MKKWSKEELQSFQKTPEPLPDGSAIRVETRLLKSKAFRTLTGTAKTVCLDFLMKRQMVKKKGKWLLTNNGIIEYTYSEAEKQGIKRQAFQHAIDALIARGFIDINKAGSAYAKGKTTLYSISKRWQHWNPDEQVRKQKGFKEERRPKDSRGGRGFKKGPEHWKNKSKNAEKVQNQV